MGKNLEFTLAAGVYVAGLTVDYLATAVGLSSNQIIELNPLYQNAISHLGIHSGLLIPKILIGAEVITMCKYANGKPILNGKTKFKAEHFLYSGALVTSAVSLSWLVDKYLF